MAGMTAANALSGMGLDVVVVEQGASLGGNAGAWACMATDECARCSACVTQEQARQVGLDPGIGVLAAGKVASVRGSPGSFELHVEPTGAEPEGHSARPDWTCKSAVDLRCDRILIASGFEPYDPHASTLLSYGRLDEVFTTRDVDHVLRRDALDEFLPGDLEEPRIAFLQCVGSRDRARGRNFCSQFCCKTTIRQAGRLLHLRPGAKITVYYIDLQIMGKEFRTFYEKMKGKVTFLQGVPDQVDHGWDDDAGTVILRSKDPVDGKALENPFDRVVLSIGISPAASAPDLATTFGVDLDEYGFVKLAGKAGGPRTSRDGVFAAGACTGPADIRMVRTQSYAAAGAIAVDLGMAAGTAAART
jgi:heterodisulfide reductase subunit A